MKLKIRGSKIDRTLRRELHEACDFFAERLLSPQMRKNVNVDVIFLKGLLKEEKMYGWCDYVDNNLKPRYFEIGIDPSLSRVRMIRTLVHELVHVKQFVYGELRDYVHKETHWCGSYVDPRTPYRKKPWEKEAFRMQNELAAEWFRLVRDDKKGVDK